MLRQRVATASILIPVILVATFYLNNFFFATFLAVFILLGAWEWAGLSGYQQLSGKLIYVTVVLSLLIACFLMRNTVFPTLIITLAIIWWVCALVLVVVHQKGKGLKISYRFLKAGIGIIILVPAWLSLVLLHSKQYDGILFVLFLFVLIWLADSAAYFSGRLWGKSKLANAVSPGKTWAGVIGAIIVSSIAGAIFALATGLQVPDIIIFSFICLLTVSGSVLGDLIESLIKRLGNVKDSGAIFPGHGGVMDRIDSLTAAAPIFLACLWVAKVFE